MQKKHEKDFYVALGKQRKAEQGWTRRPGQTVIDNECADLYFGFFDKFARSSSINDFFRSHKNDDIFTTVQDFAADFERTLLNTAVDVGFTRRRREQAHAFLFGPATTY